MTVKGENSLVEDEGARLVETCRESLQSLPETLWLIVSLPFLVVALLSLVATLVMLMLRANESVPIGVITTLVFLGIGAVPAKISSICSRSRHEAEKRFDAILAEVTREAHPHSLSALMDVRHRIGQGPGRKEIETAILSILPKVSREDWFLYSASCKSQLRLLFRWETAYLTLSPPELLLAVLNLVERVHDLESISAVRRLTKSSHDGLRTQALRCLAVLEEAQTELQQKRELLRPSHTSDTAMTLLHPVIESRNEDEERATLLRAEHKDEERVKY